MVTHLRRLTPPGFYALVFLAVGLAAPAGVAAQFQVVEPFEDHEYRELIEFVYSDLVDELNDDFALPRVVQVTSGPCQQANAFYLPADQDTESTIIMCKELVDEMISRGQTDQTTVVTQLLFIFLHEVGHAMVDVLDLPIVGQEEDAADQFAALYFSQEPVLAMWAADFWSQGGTGGSFVSMEAFADEHDLSQQRFFNIMCWTYGADPLVRGFVVQVSGLPLERAQRCQGEYDRLRSSYERLLSGFLKDPMAFADLDPTRNASGYWRFMESMMDDERQVRCSAAGTLALWQMDVDLTGSMTQDGSCVYFGAPIDDAGKPTSPLGASQKLA